MITKDDPLKNLYVDKDEVDRMRLFHSLKTYIGIDKGTGDPVFLEKYYELKDNEKIIIYLLYRKAAKALGELKDIGMSIRDLSNELNMDYDSVKERVDEISGIERDKNKGRYYIPEDNLEEAIEKLGSDEDIHKIPKEDTKRI